MRTSSLTVALFLIPSLCFATELPTPTVPDPSLLPAPRIAATPAELARLRAAWEGDDRAARRVVAEVIDDADAALKRPLEFPPRGGQHNQWYQCDKCQIALRTVDAAHHKCPKCGTVYSGEPYDDVLFSHVHSRNLHAMESAAWAYAITGQERYAQLATDVLLGYADRYREYPYHNASRSGSSRSGGHLFEQTLNEAATMAESVAPAYDLICRSKAMTDEQRELVCDGLIRPMLENIARNRAGKNNWQTWHNAAMLAAGAVLGERAWIERAIADPGNGFLDQMNESVSDDGMWYENSWGYHFYTLSALIHMAEHSRRLGIDLWNHPRLKTMFTLPAEYVMPDGRLPRFGDDTGASMGSISHALEFASHAYREPAMIPYLEKSPTWNSILLGRTLGSSTDIPPVPSRVFRSAGHAIARTGGLKGLTSVVTFGPYGGFHGHFDKLSFVFFAFGRELGVDPGRARSQAYRLPIHRDWYKATLSHNTVLVDGKSQAPAAGQLLQFDSSADRVLAVARCSEAYPGVVHTRLLLQTGDYLLVFDDLRADKPHRFDWFYHNRGKLVESRPAGRTLDASDPAFAGMEYVENAKTATTDDARVAFVTENLVNTLTFDAAPGTELLTGDGVGQSVVDRVPLVRATRRGAVARFAVVLEPTAGDAAPTVRSVSWKEDGGRLRIEVVRTGGRDLVDIDSDWKVVSTAQP
ncbi:MAG: alginate lyase family protein [Thermoguttaceae bacterium]